MTGQLFIKDMKVGSYNLGAVGVKRYHPWHSLAVAPPKNNVVVVIVVVVVVVVSTALSAQ